MSEEEGKGSGGCCSVADLIQCLVWGGGGGGEVVYCRLLLRVGGDARAHARALVRGGKEGIARRTVADLIQCLVCGGGEGGGEVVYCRLLLTQRWRWRRLPLMRYLTRVSFRKH